jgi:hypothetical protein
MSRPRRVARHEADGGLSAEAGTVGEIGVRGSPVAAVNLDEDVIDVGPDRHVLPLGTASALRSLLDLAPVLLDR